jgi:hypothetical protein
LVRKIADFSFSHPLDLLGMTLTRFGETKKLEEALPDEINSHPDGDQE